MIAALVMLHLHYLLLPKTMHSSYLQSSELELSICMSRESWLHGYLTSLVYRKIGAKHMHEELLVLH